MSTGKRLAKRSIIGTRVCAPGDDGKYYSGVITAVKTPATAQTEAGLSITAKTRFSVRFDHVPESEGRPPSPGTEYSEHELIGPGFGSVTGAQLVQGQKVYLTYNGREIQAEVTQHREHLDEVDVVTAAPTGQEGTMRLTKRIDEVRLLESRKSARLADSDTDFARLADVGSDRKRTSSHSIEVPQVIGGSRKRRPSSGNEWSDRLIQMENRGDFMDECSAAMVLMSLSTPPKNGLLPMHCQSYGSWESDSINCSIRPTVGSPGIGGLSNSSNSSSASWRSGTPSPPLSDEGQPIGSGIWPNQQNNNNQVNHHHHSNNNNNNNTSHQNHNHQYAHNQQYNASSASNSPNLRSYNDDGYCTSYMNDQDRPRKKKIRCRLENDDDYPVSNLSTSSNSENEIPITIKEEKPRVIFQCIWRGGSDKLSCGQIRATHELIEDHVRKAHLSDQLAVGEEDFYIQELPIEALSSPPTKSHWDMVKPITESPEYKRQIHRPEPAESGDERVHQHNTYSYSPTTNSANHKKLQQRSYHHQNNNHHHPHNMGSYHHHQNHINYQSNHNRQSNGINLVTVTLSKMNGSPRRLRGETKKCRKVYGMDHRELWCTQCKWKKACSRFGDHA